ncbi:MAG TPA: hypothetical protein VN253_20730 [Kofleriaceae bacterium]|nr:hypothetical protein [Kofleriaceae bacterium]
MADKPVGSELTCELEVRREGSRLALTFVLSNRSLQPRTVRYFHPFFQFELRVSANGRELAVSQPDIDMPVDPRELQVPVGGRASLEAAIRLRFASDGEAGDDRMLWTIEGASAPIELRATLRLDGVAVPPCTARA